MNIEAVTFDLDGTLLRYRESPDGVLERCFARTGHEPFFSFQDYLEVFPEFVDEADSPLELRILPFAALAREQGYDSEAGRDIAEVWGEAPADAEGELCPGAERVLTACARVYDVALITNGPSAAQQPKMATTGLADFFDTEVYAADDLRFKPDPRPFDRALDGLGTSPGATVHVGDSWAADIEGATDIGMRAVWITGKQRRSDEVEVPRIGEVDGLLELPSFERVVAD